jgi:molecular chaperone GrpE
MAREKIKLEELKKENEELRNRLKRALADYENLERRGREEKEKTVKFANEKLLAELLPVLDNLSRAVRASQDKGLELIFKQFQEVLTLNGVREIDSLNKPFDPAFHEAVEVLGEKGVVVEVLENGYQIDNKVIRPAKVRVG